MIDVTDRYRIGVIGAGARGESFARQLYAGTSRATLFGVCDIDADRLGKFCDYCELKGTERFTDPDAFLNHNNLDAVVITTPEFTHADVAVQALAAGKHIYLEKPMAHTIEDCKRILRAEAMSNATAYLGFNLRAAPPREKLKEIVTSGLLGKLVYIDGFEQLAQRHGAAFMRRFHRHSARSGGLLNHKCSHDLDILLWLAGHEHKVTRIASFGGTNVFTPDRQPAKRCGECPSDIYDACPYKASPGFVFPAFGDAPLYHRDSEIYGGDLCVFNDDKDIVDNQTVILEWDTGLRGSFALQMLQHKGARQTRIWGEKGFAELNPDDESIRIVMSDTGDTTTHHFKPATGGHGGTDPKMINRFLDAIEGQGDNDSGLAQGFAATLVALKADESRLSGNLVGIDPAEYTAD